jgi:uncharacterized protein
MTFLPDVNVWLALASRRHAHSVRCSEWLETIGPEGAFFCRVTQMGLLRLLTNQTVMGDDVVTSRDAWRAYRTILADERIGFAPEPLALEEPWRKLTSLDRPAPKLWTDAYLSAFAHTAGLRLVTLDRATLAIAADALVLR